MAIAPWLTDSSGLGVCSPRFHPHSGEPVLMRLGACWGPSSRGAAISLSVSPWPICWAVGGPREEDAVTGTGRLTRSDLGSVEFTGFFFPSMRLLPECGGALRHLSATAGFVVLLVERLVDFCRAPEVMEQDGQLACHRDDGSLLGVLAAARRDS